MNYKKALHWLIAAEIICLLLTVKIDFLGISYLWLEEGLLAYAESDIGDSLEFTNMEIFLIVFLPLYLGFFAWNFVRLWKLKKESRTVYIALRALALIITPFLGPYVDNGIMLSMDSLTSAIGGVIIGIVYFTDLRKEFWDNQAPQTTSASARV